MMRFESPGMPGAVSRFNLLTVSRSKSKVREGWDSLAGNYQFVHFRFIYNIYQTTAGYSHLDFYLLGCISLKS